MFDDSVWFENVIQIASVVVILRRGVVSDPVAVDDELRWKMLAKGNDCVCVVMKDVIEDE